VSDYIGHVEHTRAGDDNDDWVGLKKIRWKNGNKYIHRISHCRKKSSSWSCVHVLHLRKLTEVSESHALVKPNREAMIDLYICLGSWRQNTTGKDTVRAGFGVGS
jgi:hypothetical protein